MVSFPRIAMIAAIGLAVAAPAAAHGAFSELQGITTHIKTLDELPAAPGQPARMSPSGPGRSAAIRPPALDDRKYTDLVDDLNKPASAPKQLAPKATLTLPGAGTPFSGTSRVPNTTHKLHSTR
jgi:hypothetical protein